MSFILESKAFKCLFNRNIPSLCKFYLLTNKPVSSLNPEFTILLHHHRFASNDTASSIQSQNKRTTFYSEKKS